MEVYFKKEKKQKNDEKRRFLEQFLGSYIERGKWGSLSMCAEIYWTCT